MSLVINTNVASLMAQNNLTTSQNSLTQATQRLSSGLKINSAADNAAGYAISTNYTTQIGGLGQASSNASDAINLAQTTQSALSQVTANLQAISDLAVQAANGSYTATDRASINSEVQQRLSEITRIANQTQFNGQSVLNGSLGTLSFQVGANVGQTVSIAGNSGVQASKIGSLAEVSTGAIDLPAGSVTGSATTPTITDYSGTNAASFTVDGNNVTLNADYGTGATGYAAVATAVQGQLNAAVPNAYTVTADSTTGALTITNSKTANAAASAGAPVIGGSSTGVAAVFGGAAPTKADLGTTNSDFAINGTAISLSGVTNMQGLSDAINAAGIAGVSTAVNAAGNGLNFYSSSSLSITDSFSGTSGTGIINSNSTDDNTGAAFTATQTVAAGASTAVTGTQADAGGSLATGNVLTVDSANDLISRVAAALTTVSNLDSTLGAVQNRFQSTISTLSAQSDNLQSSQSTIQDADFAAETANLSKASILQQAGISVLAQANSAPQNVLKLLQ